MNAIDSDIEIARQIAKHFHHGQLDKQGRDYFEFHLTPVATMAKILAEGFFWDTVPLARAQCLAYLHDILEDTKATEEYLLERGYSQAFVDDLKSLTHDGSVTYKQYVFQMARMASIYAVVVKLADNIVNSSTLHALDDETRERLEKKYADVRVFLMRRLVKD